MERLAVFHAGPTAPDSSVARLRSAWSLLVHTSWDYATKGGVVDERDLLPAAHRPQSCSRRSGAFTGELRSLKETLECKRFVNGVA